MFSAGVAASETGGETAPDGESEAADGAAAPPPVEPPLIQVDEVSVTAARAERAVLDQPGNITIITREEILESGVNTVPELLRRQVGVFVTNKNGSNPTGIDLELRGFNNGGGNGSRTLVLIDGRRANLPQTGNTDWALMRIDDVERIEIVRGPASAVYGDNAIGGVIEIFTRRSDKGLQFNATGRGGSYGMGQGSLFAGGSVSDFSGSLFIDGYTADGYRERSDFTTGKAKGNLRYRLGEVQTDRLVGRVHVGPEMHVPSHAHGHQRQRERNESTSGQRLLPQRAITAAPEQGRQHGRQLSNTHAREFALHTCCAARVSRLFCRAFAVGAAR